MRYNNTCTGFILRPIGAHQTYSQYLISFISSVLYKDVFLVTIVKKGSKACQKSGNVYLLKLMKICTYIEDMQIFHWCKIQDGVQLRF